MTARPYRRARWTFWMLVITLATRLLLALTGRLAVQRERPPDPRTD